MISKFNPYNKKYLNPKELLYVKVINELSYYIYIYLNYTLNGKIIEKQSPVFPRYESQLLTFPSGAEEIFFTIYNCRYNPPRRLFSKIIPNYRSTCYKVKSNFSCIEVPC